MLDLGDIRRNPHQYVELLSRRMDDVDLEPIFRLDDTRRELMQSLEQARASLKQQSRDIGKLRREGADTVELQAEAIAVREQVAGLQQRLRL